jgi:hypothetical protein
VEVQPVAWMCGSRLSSPTSRSTRVSSWRAVQTAASTSTRDDLGAHTGRISDGGEQPRHGCERGRADCHQGVGGQPGVALPPLALETDRRAEDEAEREVERDRQDGETARHQIGFHAPASLGPPRWPEDNGQRQQRTCDAEATQRQVGQGGWVYRPQLPYRRRTGSRARTGASRSSRISGSLPCIVKISTSVRGWKDWICRVASMPFIIGSR